MRTNQLQRSFVFFMLIVVSMTSRAAPITQFVTVIDREWAQVDLFTNLNWIEMNAQCPAGVCGGTLNGLDVGGWTWASISEVGALFNVISGGVHPGGIASISEASSTWAPAWFDLVGFDPTFVTVGARYTYGISRTLTLGGGSAITGYVQDGITQFPDIIDTNQGLSVFGKGPDLGGWFYRDISSTSVPEPSSIILLSVGLLGLGFSRRKRLHQ